MSLLDNVRQTIGSAASSALEMGQNLSAQAQAQLNIKKLQLEQAKKLHDLGARTYEWHKSGTLVATGTVPREVYDLCHTLDDLNAQLVEQQKKLEEAKLEAELRAAKGGDAGSGAATATPTTAIALPPAAPAVTAQTVTSAPTATDHTTQILGDSMQTTNYTPTLSTGITAGGPDITQPTIPVPGPDMPATSPEIPSGPMAPNIPSNPDLPSPSQPTMPGIPAPGGPSIPSMPGQPSSPTM